MAVEIRAIASEEFEAFTRMTHVAFGAHLNVEEVQAHRTEFEPGRSLAALDGDRMVGGTSAVSFRMTVPGGDSLPTAGVTSVGVIPTHTRRGILLSLMRRQLDDVREAGEPLAALWASEGTIYGRFGYGMAAWASSIDVEKAWLRFRDDAPDGGTVRLVERERFLEDYQPIYERIWRRRPGMMRRNDKWARHRFFDPESEREGYSAFFFAMHAGNDGDDGYVVYRTKHDWTDEFPGGVVQIEELAAADDDAYAGLWRYLGRIDLMKRIECWHLGQDEPLLYMVLEPRRLKFRLRDGLWIRVVDVPAALEGRQYAAPGAVRLEVRDEFCPWNNGRYELEAAPDGASCSKTDKDPDLVLTAADLGAVYLGGPTLAQLWRAGRVTERRAGAVAEASRLFAWDPQPWSSHIF